MEFDIRSSGSAGQKNANHSGSPQQYLYCRWGLSLMSYYLHQKLVDWMSYLCSGKSGGTDEIIQVEPPASSDPLATPANLHICILPPDRDTVSLGRSGYTKFTCRYSLSPSLSCTGHYKKMTCPPSRSSPWCFSVSFFIRSLMAYSKLYLS